MVPSVVDPLPGVAIVGTVTFDLITPVISMPTFGALQPVPGVASSVGGAPGNSGMTLARLGVPTFVGGRVGDDHFGRFVHSQLAAECDVSGVIVSPTGSTSVTLVMVAPDGERGFLYHSGVNATYCATDVSVPTLAAAGVRHLHVAYTTLLPALSGPSLQSLLRAARAAGMTTSIDVTWDPSGAWLTPLGAAVTDVDLFAPNRDEALAITGCSTVPDAAAALLELGVGETVVITLDAGGSYTLHRDGTSFSSCAPPVTVVDSTGAGDAFLAGWFAARVRGLALPDAIAVANATAACAVTTPRACDGITGWNQVSTLAAAVTHF